MDRPNLNPTRDFFSAEINQSTNINGKDGKTPPPELRQLVEYVSGLKAERRKIEAFKRELPLCLDLLNDAVEMFEVELRKGKRGVVCCNLSEVGGLTLENGVEDMKNWMSSVHLWNHHDNDSHDLESVTGIASDDKEIKGSAMEISERSDGQLSLRHPVAAPVVELIHLCGENDVFDKGNMLVDEPTVPKKIQRRCWSPRQVCRKERRCWSQELHRRFVDALQQLGGSEVATPRQIRDIMRVEGLTNDEVKSHLQKYRLHIRKTSLHFPLPPSPGCSPSTNQDDNNLLKLNAKSHSVSPLGPLDILAGCFKCSTSVSNNTTLIDEEEDEDEEETEGHSWRNQNHVVINI